MEFIDHAIRRIASASYALSSGGHEYGRVPSSYYQQELDPENFRDVDALILDESVVIDIIKGTRREREINGERDHLATGYKTLELLDHVIDYNRRHDDDIDIVYTSHNCRYHPNGTEEGTIGQHVLKSIHDYMQECGEQLALDGLEEEAPEEWRNHGPYGDDLSEDWAISQMAVDSNAMVVATDDDFKELEQEYDFTAMTPDLAELGFRALNETDEYDRL